MSKEFKVLSIDGGGMKGVYSARILAEFERIVMDRNPDERIVDYFDLICGTSTGGLIALALSQRITASKIVEFYETNGSLIFPELSKYHRIASWKKLLWRLKDGWVYSNRPLRDALFELFGDKVLGQSECLLCIPSYSLTKGQPFIFKWDHPEGKLSRDNIFKYVDVGLATSAAPMFFPKVTFTDPSYGDFKTYQFVDGGIYANNPSMIGLTESLNYFVGTDKEFDSLSLLSIASLNESAAERPNMPENQFVNIWAQQLNRALMAGQSFSTDFSVQKICESTELRFRYVRIPSDTVGKEHSPNIQLDVASPDAISLMKTKGYEQALLFGKEERVLKFFETRKEYITNRKDPSDGKHS